MSRMRETPWLPRPAVVLDIWSETPDTWTLLLEASEAAPSRGLPGQFNLLGILGVGEVPISMSGFQDGCLLHTIRAVGSVTRMLVDRKAGDVLGLRGPYGIGWPLEALAAAHLLIVAGGLGLAPLRPMVEAFMAQARPHQRLTLLYGARTPRDLLFTREFARWQAHPGVSLHLTVDRADPGWSHRVGVVTRWLPELVENPRETWALVCGPEVMMRFALLELEKQGVPAFQTFVSLERHMKCAVGQCGHCMWGPRLVCRDGPVFRVDQTRGLWVRGL